MSRTIADWSARVLALAVLAFGGLVVVKPAVDNWDELYRATPFEVGTTTQTVERRTPGERTETTTRTTEQSSSFAERLLGHSGLLLVRLGLVALVALLAAAVLHRVLLADVGLRRRAQAAATEAPDPHDRVPGPAEAATAPMPAATNGEGAAPETAGANLAPGIAKLVSSRRETLGLSQRELAKRAGISHTVVSRIESGDHSPSPRTLERLAEALR